VRRINIPSTDITRRPIWIRMFCAQTNYHVNCGQLTQKMCRTNNTNFIQLHEHSEYQHILQLEGYIVWNAHNTAFGSKCSAICARAVYFLHSMRPSFTWLNSR